MPQESVALPSGAGPKITYRSFLLRLRWVEGEEESYQQFFVKDVQSQEDVYFASPVDMVDYLLKKGGDDRERGLESPLRNGERDG